MLISLKSWLTIVAVTATMFWTSLGQAQHISEVYMDSPNGAGGLADVDVSDYFEVCGTASTDFVPNNHRIFFVALECENSNDVGVVEFVYEFAANATFNGAGSYWVACENEVLTETPDAVYDPDPAHNPAANNEDDVDGSTLENSGSTYLLVDVATTGGATMPAVGQDWDSSGTSSGDGDGVLDNTVTHADYTILDSVGLVREDDDICPGATLYGDVNFFAGRPWEAFKITTAETTKHPVPTDYEVDPGGGNGYGPGDELEYIARCNDCNGEWYAAEVDQGGGQLTVDESGGRPKAIGETQVAINDPNRCNSPGADNVNCANVVPCP